MGEQERELGKEEWGWRSVEEAGLEAGVATVVAVAGGRRRRWGEGERQRKERSSEGERELGEE